MTFSDFDLTYLFTYFRSDSSFLLDGYYTYYCWSCKMFKINKTHKKTDIYDLSIFICTIDLHISFTL